jgi:hypothetical protein
MTKLKWVGAAAILPTALATLLTAQEATQEPGRWGSPTAIDGFRKGQPILRGCGFSGSRHFTSTLIFPIPFSENP